MKRTAHALLLSLMCCTLSSANDDNFQVIITPSWQCLDNDQRACAFGGNWVLVGSITFKKKIKNDVALDRLYLHWKGPWLENVIGSLYTKANNKKFLPIEENLVCDSTWHKSEQLLKLSFDEEHRLGAINTYYLVLTVPENQKRILHDGQFDIVTYHLPEVFQKPDLALSLDVTNTSVHH